MNIAQLHALNRRLHDIALAATADGDGPPISAGQLAIVEDIFAHSSTSIGEITQRTSLAQSFVSKTVASLVAADFVLSEPVENDKRTHLISINPAAKTSIVRRRSDESITVTLARLLPQKNARDIQAIETLLHELATNLDI